MNKALIVLPVYNEEKIIEGHALKILNYCQQNLQDDFQIVIADNASSDATSQIAQRLTQLYPQIKYYHLEQRGKGLAIKSVWRKFEADFYIFMDADLSTDLSALPNLLEVLKTSGADLVAGSRYLKNSQIKRSSGRLIISKIYNLIINILFRCSIHDLANGFKGANRLVVEKILPLTKNEKWFFDSELTLLTHHYGYRVKEIPVAWQEHRTTKSRVNIISTSLEYLIELIKLKLRLIGAIS